MSVTAGLVVVFVAVLVLAFYVGSWLQRIGAKNGRSRSKPS